MSNFTPFENEVSVDSWTTSFERLPTDSDVDKTNTERQLEKHWATAKSDVDGLGGLKLTKPKMDTVFETLVASKQHAVIYNLVLTKTDFHLDLVIGNTTMTVGKVRVPTDLEEYRGFLASLSGWSQGDHNLVPDGDFKKFNEKNPKKPTYKTYEDMAKSSKADTDAFKGWAKSNAKAKKAVEEVDKTAKAKANDPARVAALKAVNASYQEWLKTF